MPRKQKLKRRGKYHDGHRLQLRSGHDYFSDAFGNSREPEVMESMRLAWEQLGVEVMAEHDEWAAGKICRPWGWWEFESPEPRDETIPEWKQLGRLSMLTAAEIALLNPKEPSK